MQPQTWTAMSIEAHQSDLKQRIHELISLKDSVLKEAHARGLGFGAHAALKAALKSTPELSARAFNKADFVQRIAELSDDVSAEVVTEILDDVKLDVSVIKRSEQRQRADRYNDIAHDVDVAVTFGRISAAALNTDVQFHLPEFGGGQVSSHTVSIRSMTDVQKRTPMKRASEPNRQHVWPSWWRVAGMEASMSTRQSTKLTTRSALGH
jgi:hypothetical protein